MRSVRLGWRWNGEELVFTKAWQEEECRNGMTGLEKTLEIIQAIMNSICNFLKLTMESVMDFNGVLPTLDLIIWVGMTTRSSINSTRSPCVPIWYSREEVPCLRT